MTRPEPSNNIKLFLDLNILTLDSPMNSLTPELGLVTGVTEVIVYYHDIKLQIMFMT